MKTKYLSRRSLASAGMTVLLLAALPVAAVFAASAGPSYPGSAVSSGTGTAWTASSGTLTEALGANDTVVAQAVLAGSGGSQSLDLTDFGFSIPGDAAIAGISVEINRFASDALSIQDVTVQLLKDRAPAGTNKAFTGGTWATHTATTAFYGSSSDLWGTGWTPEEINASSFGLTLDVTNLAGAERTASVDFVRITVTYTLAASLSVTNSPVTYDGTPKTATVTGSVPGTVSDIRYDGSSTPPTDAGTYAVTADFVPTDPNYSSLNDAPAGDFVIEKAPQDILAVNDPSPVTFGSTATLTTTGGSGTGAVTFSTGASTGCSVAGDILSVTDASGTCAVTATKAGDDNYLPAVSLPVTVTLQKAETVTTVTGGAFTYDGLAHEATVSVTGPGGLSLTPSATYSGSCSAAPVTVAEGASCTASYTYPGDNNYLGSSDSDTVTITKADATIQVTAYHVTYDGSEHMATGTATGVNGEDLSAGLDLSGTAHTDAGIYPDDPWTFTSPNENYNDASGTVSNSIARATAFIIVTPYEVVYDGMPHTATGEVVGVNGEDLSAGLDLSGTTHTDAGTYPDDPWVFTSPNSNYNNSSGTIEDIIQPLSLTITGLTANDKPYDGTTAATLSGTPVLVGVLPGDTVTLAGTPVAEFADPEVGEDKPVTVTGFTLSGPDAGNYTVTQPTGLTASITPAPLTVTGITASNKVYDGTTTATLNVSSTVLVGVAPGDTVTLNTAGAVGEFADENAGTGKTVTISGLTLSGADAGKYTLVQPTTTADITPRELTITATGQDKVYDGTTAATVTLAGDPLPGDTITLSYTSAAFADPNVGTDKTITVSGISIGGADADNYSPPSTPVTATADITPAVLTVTADDKVVGVGQPDPPFTFTYSGLVSGDTPAVIDTPPTCSVSVPHADPGTYPIVCSGAADNNYTFTYVDGTLIVDPNVVPTPTFDDVDTTYWAYSFIERLAAAGITGGCSTNPPQYCPEASVTRAEMAVFLLRGIHGAGYSPPAVGSSTGFGDVPTTYWAAAWIKQLAAEGITTGCGGGNYCPESPVTRAEMAVFLLRSEHGSSYTPPAVGSSTGFGDVPTTYWAAAWIKQLVTEGITSGCGGGNYCPESPVTRAEMAVFLVRTFNLP